MQQIIDLFIVMIATSGLSLIVTSSTLFKPLRTYIEKVYAKNMSSRIWWFLHSISKCSLCFGVWASLFNYGLLYFKIYILLYAFSGSLAAYFFDNYITKLKKY